MVSKKRQDELRQQLKTAGAELADLEQRQEATREQIRTLIVAALKAGIPPGEVGALVPLSRETIRTIARIAGIPPASRGGAR